MDAPKRTTGAGRGAAALLGTALLTVGAAIAIVAPGPAAAQVPTSCAGKGPKHANGVLIVNREPKGDALAYGEPLLTVGSDGRHVRKLTSPGRQQSDGPLYAVAASPDGRSAAFVRVAGNTSVQIVSLATRRRRTVIVGNRPLPFAPPSFSADGRTIAVATNDLHTGLLGTWLVRSDGTGAHPLAAAANFSERAFSPNGRCLVGFLADMQGGHVAVVPAGGGAASPLPGLPGAFKGIDAMRFTPDGRRIVFTGITAALRAGVWSVNLDGTGLRKLVSLRRGSDAAVFSPDGRWMAYTDRKGTMVRPVSGGRAHRLLKGLWVKAWAPRPR
jgi:Tol biopolymer transport system component